jgi:acyl dehydratase
MQLKDLSGFDLGSYEANYTTRDAILYALAVGASASQLDLIYERDLRVLPTYACALGLWAVERAGDLGAYDRKRSLHASQALVVHRPMPREGSIRMRSKIEAVWDKDKATVVEIAVNSDFFDATYTIFLPGVGNWGGAPGPATPAVQPPESEAIWQAAYNTAPTLAALYRLTGDLHPIHIDTEVAKANNFDKPILHGLCTLGIAARMIADAGGSHPCDLRAIKARLSAPVTPGECIKISARVKANAISFEADVNDRAVLKSGEAIFAT